MVLGIIPARYASTRFPGKPLVPLNGAPLLWHTWNSVVQAGLLDEVVIATDDERIREAASSWGAQVRMTREEHPSGTDRCGEVLAHYPEAAQVINIQGDEPFTSATSLKLLRSMLQSTPAPDIATLAVPLTDKERLFSEHQVKVVCGTEGQALYFSRQAIPAQRGIPREQWLDTGVCYLKHVGMYGYQAAALPQLCQLQPGILEQAEQLEQLRWMEAGYRIQVGIIHEEPIGIDTPEDLQRAEAFLRTTKLL